MVPILKQTKKNEGYINVNDLSQVQNEPNKLVFAESHHGHDFSHLRRQNFQVIPVLNIQKGSLCSIKELDLNSDALTDKFNGK